MKHMMCGLLLVIVTADLVAQQDSGVRFDATVFGTTVAISAGLHGDIYDIPPGSQRLPNLGRLKPIGSVYTNELNVGVQSFLEGFPGVTGRNEWFAIDYCGRFWIEDPGQYTFSLLSDDGSKLYIDGRVAVNNDGTHSARGYAGRVKLKQGWHQIRISYYQGPRDQVALILAYAVPGNSELLVFNTEDFLPPADREELLKSKPGPEVNSAEWRRKRQPAMEMRLARQSAIH
jgi:hypothetical protein